MPIYINDTKQMLSDAGDALNIGFERITPTSGIISWDIPKPIGSYDGILVLMKPAVDVAPEDFPVDSTRYSGSQDMSSIADKIGGAVVVGAFYGDKMTTTITVVNLDPEMVYFVSGHVVDNVLHYNTGGNYAYDQVQKTDAFTGQIKKLASPPANPIEGSVYFNTSVAMTFMFDGSDWVQCTRGRNSIHRNSTATTRAGSYGYVSDEFKIGYDTDRTFPDTSNGYDIGRFFYHTVQKKLFVWTGQKWVQANTEYEGVPIYSVNGIGTDGTTDEFDAMTNVLKRKLGWPQVCVELNDTDFTNAINEAVAMLRRRCDNAYEYRYIMVQAKAGQSLYYLNDPENGTDSIVDVIKITRMDAMGMSLFSNGDVYMQSFMSDFTSSGTVDLTSIHMMAEYSEIFERIFAHDIGFIWNESRRHLQLLKRLNRNEVMLMECSCERPVQELLQDRWLQDWIEDWAIAECMMKLAMIRTKYGTLPGPGGGITMNGTELQQQATESFAELLRQISDLEIGNGATFGNTSFLIG